MSDQLYSFPLTLALSRKGRGDTSVRVAKVSVQTIGSTNPPVAKRTRISPISAPPLPLWERAGVRGFLRPINAKRRCDLHQRAFGVGEDFIVPKPEHPEAVALKTQGSLTILCRAALMRMLAAVNFDNEFGVEATEISNVRTNRNLPAEFEALETPVAQQRPQPPLRIGLIAPEETRARYAHKVGPLTLALSHKGRGDTSVSVAKVSVQTTDNTSNHPPLIRPGLRVARCRKALEQIFLSRTHINQISVPPLPSWERDGVRGAYA